VRRQFPRVLDIGASHGVLLPHLARGFGVEEVVQVESSEQMLMRDARLPEHSPDGVTVHRLAWDEEHLLLPPVRCAFRLVWLCAVPSYYADMCYVALHAVGDGGFADRWPPE
jgi:SAM-dependent methyltransferase